MDPKTNAKFQNTIITQNSKSKSIFSNLDFTSPEPRIKIFGSSRYRNPLGALISLIWFALLVLLSFHFISDFVSQNKFTVIENSFLSDSPKLNLNETPIMLLLQNNLTEPIDPRAYRVNFLFWVNKIIKHANGTRESVSTQYEIPAENCEQKHFGHNWILFKDIPNLQKYICLPKDDKYNLTLYGTYGDIKAHSLLGIYISKCVKSENSNRTSDCFEDKKIIDFSLRNAFVNLKFLVFKTEHYSNVPYSSHVYSVDIPISITIYKREYLYISNVNYRSDDNLFIRIYKNYFFHFVYKHISYVDFEDREIFPGNFACVNLLMTDLNKIFNRFYYKVPDLLADIGGLSRIIRVFAHFLNGYFYSTLFYVKLISSYFNFKQENDCEDYEKREFRTNNYWFNQGKNLFNENNNKKNQDEKAENFKFNMNRNNKNSKDEDNLRNEIIEEEFLFKPFSYEKDNQTEIEFIYNKKFISNSDKNNRKSSKKKKKFEKSNNEVKKLNFYNIMGSSSNLICEASDNENIFTKTNNKNIRINEENEITEKNIFNNYSHKQSSHDRIQRFDLDFKSDKKENNFISNSPEYTKLRPFSKETQKLNFLISESLGNSKQLTKTLSNDSLKHLENLNLIGESYHKKSINVDKSSILKKSILSRGNYLNKKYEYKYKVCNYFYCPCFKSRKVKDFAILKDYLNRQMSIDFIIKKIREIDKLKIVMLELYQIPIFNSMPYKVISLKNGLISNNSAQDLNENYKRYNNNNKSLVSSLINDSIIEENENLEFSSRKFANKETLFDYDYNSYILKDALTSSHFIEKKNKRSNVDKNLLKFWECNEYEN